MEVFFMEDEKKAKIAKLEFLNDQLEAEIVYIDQLMVAVGFSKGLQTLKETANNLALEEEKEIDSDDF